MQTDYKLIYKELGEKEGNEELYKDIGNYIFNETHTLLNNPPSLVIRLKGVGRWYLRKKRMEIYTQIWEDRSFDKPREEFESDWAYDEYHKKRKQFNYFLDRLKDYEGYMDMKKEVRQKRNLTQTIIPKKDMTKFKSK